ncbi:MAG: hypothetical protein DHS20C17_07910 [Cyclobacteriaceae bacterium]|nr:MAG: hypothetical protein DHS20C17_07910 [Cyclobacteriaceae bacterium]
MIKCTATLLLIILLNTVATAQPSGGSGNVELGLATGIASGWWIYTLGTGAGIDRTDNVPKISFEGVFVFKPHRFGIGAGLGYSFLTDNTMETFEDTRAQRQKYSIANKVVQFWTYYLLAEYDVYSDGRYSLSPQLKAGGFGIDTTHPQKANFKTQFLTELSALNKIDLSGGLSLTLRPFYQVMMISTKEDLLPGEKHRIFSLGLSFGVRYNI